MSLKLLEKRESGYLNIVAKIGILFFMIILLGKDVLNILPIGWQLKHFSIFISLFYFLPIVVAGQLKLNYKEIGELELSESNIQLNIKNKDILEFTVSDIKKAQLYLEEKDSLFLRFYYVMKLVIELNEDKQIINHFYIRDKKELTHYLEILKRLYRKGMNLKEYNQKGERIFLLQSNLKYQDIQEIKEEYGIQWN